MRRDAARTCRVISTVFESLETVDQRLCVMASLPRVGRMVSMTRSCVTAGRGATTKACFNFPIQQINVSHNPHSQRNVCITPWNRHLNYACRHEMLLNDCGDNRSGVANQTGGARKRILDTDCKFEMCNLETHFQTNMTIEEGETRGPYFQH